MTLCKRTIASNIAGVNTCFAVPPDQGAYHVQRAEGYGKNRRCQQKLGEVTARCIGIFGSIFIGRFGRAVEIAKDVAAEHNHNKPKPPQTTPVRQHRPGIPEVLLERFKHGELGKYQNDANDGVEGERCALEHEVRWFLFHLDHKGDV